MYLGTKGVSEVAGKIAPRFEYWVLRSEATSGMHCLRHDSFILSYGNRASNRTIIINITNFICFFFFFFFTLSRMHSFTPSLTN